MNVDERDRMTRLESEFRAHKDETRKELAEIKGTLAEVRDLMTGAKGAWWLLVKIGSLLAIAAGFWKAISFKLGD
jgi:hypothetical protein